MKAGFCFLSVVGGLLLCTPVRVIPADGPVSWRPPVPLEELNTPDHDKAAFQSFDGLTLYFCRDDGPGGYSRIYRATRTTPFEPFGPAELIDSLSEAGGHVAYPWVSPDDLRMYYYSTWSGRQLRVSSRETLDEPWRPGDLLTELNVYGGLANPTLTADESIIVFSGYRLAGGRGDWDLWMADRMDRQEPFGNLRNLESLNTDAWDMHPSLSPDGLTLYFASNRGGHFQIFRAHRPSREADFDAVEHLVVFDTPDGSSLYPSVSSDGSVFYFGSQPDGAFMDIYASYPLGVLYVGGRYGSDTHDGSHPQAALATIQKAIDTAGAGEVINVLPGVYREAVRFGGKAVTVRSAGDAAILEAPEAWAVSFQAGERSDSILKNLIIRNSLVGIWMLDSAPTITNVTVVGNAFGIDASGWVEPRISNCILWGNAVSDLYGCGATYSCIERGGAGEGNFRDDPLFVDPENGDYHVRSARGRYRPVHDVWVLDDVSSPCIDAGDPAADFSAEREPNGGRLNIGAHGGTPFGALSE